MSDRGKKKWLPFKSLKEQNEYLEKAFNKHRLKESLIQTPEQKEEISAYLSSYRGQITTIYYIKDYEIVSQTGIINKVDISNQCLQINEDIVPFNIILSFKDN